jgi:UDP-N-acetyl-D-mannosaminuronic acid transferase (WecB/TagA/CpsF family)
MKKLAGGDPQLLVEAKQVLLREVSLLVLEGVKDGYNLFRIPSITFQDAI